MFATISSTFAKGNFARFPRYKYVLLLFAYILLTLVQAKKVEYAMLKNPLKILELSSKVAKGISIFRNVNIHFFIKKKSPRRGEVHSPHFYFLNCKAKLKRGQYKKSTKINFSSAFDVGVGDVHKTGDIGKIGQIGGSRGKSENGEKCAEAEIPRSGVVPGEKVLYLVNPRGFCKGVSRAIETVEECLKLFKTTIYVKHKIVHNDIVCKELEKKGAVFIEDLNDVPDGSILIYSAHGISPQIREIARKKKIIEIDATCPLVNKVHVYVQVKTKEGYKIILIGHKNHVEVIGTYNESPECTYIVENVKDVENLSFSPDEKLFYVTQTTLSMDDCALIVNKLKEKFPSIETIPSGSICYATTNRQNALNQICTQCDLTIVVGSQSSSNAKKLVYSSQIRNVPAVLVNTVEDFNFDLLKNVRKIALTSAASTPEELTQNFVKVLTNPPFMYKLELFDGVQENVPKWKLPKNLLNFMKEGGASAQQ
ncbi:4-hydroxy-3-methylbut-2-enyl diphosphate reductase, putative (LytB) [Plasmodium ovale wallikeri]|uniref:4-hydroxy-3-methylbut-2-enyl diphosphate reductase n=2 Tax=Plasmodium ovale TaxID=36330 RepID=A0A1A8YII2_PLAOA|nr:4-hydroxy-3-methylbut-2-enyl diphosphate reductase, putative (LytB) [Plasmodium ovale wallikeri]SBT31353.1 4-hydroxy-3-methylbut-2-enyl diphosphate reductase, putative (LytB) [Plasmodium ovale wallikeri]SBT75326.1 4-hydroxy-3-methylbut-2-enyl diphosphate reductase, putative [Plasmodium ovale]